MIDSIKTYLIQAGVKKYLPMAVLGGMTALGTFMAAHAGVLEQWGVTYGTWPLQWATGQIPSGPVILVELDTLNASLIVLLSGLVAMILRATQHHTTGTPVVTPPAEGEIK